MWTFILKYRFTLFCCEAFFARIYALFGQRKMVAYKKWQIWGMLRTMDCVLSHYYIAIAQCSEVFNTLNDIGLHGNCCAQLLLHNIGLYASQLLNAVWSVGLWTVLSLHCNCSVKQCWIAQCSVKCWMTLDNIALHCITLNYMAIAQCSCCCTTLDCMHCNCLMQYEVLDCALSHYYIAIAQLDNVELLSAVLNVG